MQLAARVNRIAISPTSAVLAAAEKLQRDVMLLSGNRTAVEISPILRPIPIPSGAQRLYRKLPRGFRKMVRRIAGLPY